MLRDGDNRLVAMENEERSARKIMMIDGCRSAEGKERYVEEGMKGL